MLKKIKFFNSDTGQWEIVAVGEKGDRGEQGIQGERGYHFTPSVDNEGNLEWTNDGDLNNPATVNIKGPKGDTGPQGLQGDKGDTGPQGEKGDKGDQGIQGEVGPKGEKGDKGDQGEPGLDGVQSNSINAIEIVPELPLEGEWINGVLYIVVEGEGGE